MFEQWRWSQTLRTQITAAALFESVQGVLAREMELCERELISSCIFADDTFSDRQPCIESVQYLKKIIEAAYSAYKSCVMTLERQVSLGVQLLGATGTALRETACNCEWLHQQVARVTAQLNR